MAPARMASVPVSGLLPWLCPLSSLEQQEVEGSGVLGVPTPKGRAGGSSLSIQPPVMSWVPPSIPRLRLLTLKLKSMRPTGYSPAPSHPGGQSRGSTQCSLPSQTCLFLHQASSARPCRVLSGREFQNFEDELRRCAQGAGHHSWSHSRACREDASPDATGKQNHSPHVYPPFLGTPHSAQPSSPGLPESTPFGLLVWFLGPLQPPECPPPHVPCLPMSPKSQVLQRLSLSLEA